MKKCKDMTLEDTSNLDKGMPIIIFGAGGTGRNLCRTLTKQGYQVIAFWDNDILKQGQEIDAVKVISYGELSAMQGYNLVLGTAYAIQEIDKIIELDCVNIINFISEDYAQKWLDSETQGSIQKYLEKSTEVIELLIDEKSKNICEKLYYFIAYKNNNYLKNLATQEEHFLIKEVKSAMPERAVMVDVGAFTGEFPVALLKEKIGFKKCYSFEANHNTCVILTDNMRKKGILDKVVCIDKGLSEKKGTMYFEDSSNTATTSLVEHEAENKVEVVSIDEYFENIPFDFLKMDIEGMELPVLRGGLNAIKRYRPILAISIYHSLSDRIDIPLFLNCELDDYVFLMRHHSIWFGETVLYALPKESYKASIG